MLFGFALRSFIACWIGTVTVLLAGSVASAQSLQAALVIESHLGGSCPALYSTSGYVYKSEGRGLSIYDSQDASNPVHLSSMAFVNPITDIEKAGDILYLSNQSSGLQIVSIANPSAPFRLLQWQGSGVVHDAVLSGTILYVAAGTEGLVSLDVRHPAAPKFLGRYNTPGNAQEVHLQGTRAYVADGTGGFLILDISHPESPVLLGYHGITGKNYIQAVAGLNSVFFILTDDSQILIYDVQDPRSPINIGALNLDQCAGLAVQGNLLITARKSGYDFYNVSNPRTPVLKLSDPQVVNTQSLAVDGGRLYLGDDKGALTLVRIVSESESQISAVWPGFTRVQEVALSDTAAYVLDTRSVTIVEFNGPGSAVARGRVNASYCYDIAYANGRVALTGANLTDGFIHLLDVRSSANPLFLGTTDIPGSSVDLAANNRVAITTSGRFERISLYNLLSQSQPDLITHFTLPDYGLELDINNETAYVAIENVGFAIVDIRNPQSPVQRGLYTLDAGMRVSDIVAQENMAYLLVQNTGLMTFDITQPANPRRLGLLSAASRAVRLAVSGKWAVAVTSDKMLLLMDISDPVKPLLVDSMAFDTLVASVDFIANRISVIEDGVTFLRIVEPSSTSGLLVY